MKTNLILSFLILVFCISLHAQENRIVTRSYVVSIEECLSKQSLVPLYKRTFTGFSREFKYELIGRTCRILKDQVLYRDHYQILNVIQSLPPIFQPVDRDGKKGVYIAIDPVEGGYSVRFTGSTTGSYEVSFLKKALESLLTYNSEASLVSAQVRIIDYKLPEE